MVLPLTGLGANTTPGSLRHVLILSPAITTVSLCSQSISEIMHDNAKNKSLSLCTVKLMELSYYSSTASMSPVYIFVGGACGYSFFKDVDAKMRV